MSAASDDAGVMKTTDPERGGWTKVLRYQDLTRAVSCAAGTPQQALCVASWCTVCGQLGCTPAATYVCPGSVPPRAGCCDSGEGGAAALALGLVVGTMLLRPSRRREI